MFVCLRFVRGTIYLTLCLVHHSMDKDNWAIAHKSLSQSVRMHTVLAIHLPIPFADFRDVLDTVVM
jgi:hypothetical protein